MILTLSANAGVSLETEKSKILVDAFHDEKTETFSTVEEDLLPRVEASPHFRDADAIMFTHDHPDHYSIRMTEKMLKVNPGCRPILPWEMGLGPYDVAGSTIRFFVMPHDGAGFDDVLQHAALISTEEGTVLFSGDTMIGCREMEYLVMNRDIDVAVMNFPWITLKKGREFICRNLRPKVLVAVHIPFEKDDLGGYREAVKKSAIQLSDEMDYALDVRLLLEPLQSESVLFNIAKL